MITFRNLHEARELVCSKCARWLPLKALTGTLAPIKALSDSNYGSITIGESICTVCSRENVMNYRECCPEKSTESLTR